jgi:hypothetical protein
LWCMRMGNAVKLDPPPQHENKISWLLVVV